MVADPGAMGDVPRRAPADRAGRPRDHHQNPPAWHEMPGAYLVGLARQAREPVSVPMTVPGRSDAGKLFTPRRRSPTGFHNLVRRPARGFLRARIAAGRECSREPRAQQRSRTRSTAAGWMRAEGHVIDTGDLTPGQTLPYALAHHHADCPSALLTESDPR
ncbi:ATP/GTP-binding protein [Streptomyces sp. NPDC004667]|uniref:ATP/GTP-binding protein n=1 Tax=Streptomyces sp. NPDC004667 TaxID=3154285 RepID=UPI0033B48D21